MQRKFAIRFRFADLGGDAGRHFSGRAGPARWLHLFAGTNWLRLGQICAYDRRSFGKPVTFENLLLKAFLETFGKVERQFLRTSDDKSQAAELVRLSFAQVAAQKCRRR